MRRAPPAPGLTTARPRLVAATARVAVPRAMALQQRPQPRYSTLVVQAIGATQRVLPRTTDQLRRSACTTRADSYVLRALVVATASGSVSRCSVSRAATYEASRPTPPSKPDEIAYWNGMPTK